MILGISGSPRPNRITDHAVKEVLSNYQGETKFISLAGKKISGCIGCLGCIEDNMCVVKDDFLEIAKAMVEADGIVIGVPNYYDLPNALSHSLLERCFCFRHKSNFLLKDKPVVIISTGYSKDEENNPVLKIVEHFINSNHMDVVSKFLVGGYSQCYTCKAGLTCVDGNIVKKHGFVDRVIPEILPPEFDKQLISIKKCQDASKLLQKYLSKEKK